MATYDKEEFMNYDEHKPKKKTDKTVFGLKDNLTFGKYKGERVEDVIKDNKAYISWCLDNVQFFKLSEEALALYMETKRKPRKRRSRYSDAGDVKGASHQGMVDCFGGSGMDGGWGSSPFG